MGVNKKLYGWYSTGKIWLPIKVDTTGKVVISAIPGHHLLHENGGSDEISVLGLSGLLADSQTPLAHASSHAGGSDPLYYIPSDGWIPGAGTWTYASATTITVPTGATSIYQVHDKVKLTQSGTVKYFYITAVADTLLTVSGYAGAVVVAVAITLPFFSSIANPLGFTGAVPQYLIATWDFTHGSIPDGWSLYGNIGSIVQSTNLQGFWKFENNFNDSSGNGYTLTEVGGTVDFNASGKIGSCADFEVDDTESVSIDNALCANLRITGEISLFAWIKLETLASVLTTVECIAGKMLPTDTNRAYRLAIITTNKLQVTLSPDGTALTNATSITPLSSTGVWYHVGFTLNQATDLIQCYINGVADGAAVAYATDIYNASKSFAIGSNATNLSHWFDGLIDEVMVWNKCLTPAEISLVYYSGGYSTAYIIKN